MSPRSRAAIRQTSLIVALTFLLCASVSAQQFKAAVNGTVTDDQGRVLPGVTVTLANVDTTVPIETVTDSKGVYAIEDLIPGRYRLSATMQGFKGYVRDGIVLETAETATVNISLTMGAIEETVTVTAPLSGRESNSSVLSQTMENKRISELPLDGGQVYQLLQLTSGTLFLQEQFGATGSSGTRAWDVAQGAQFSIHGSRTGNNEFLIDGAPNAGTGTWSYSPPVEAIQEFKVDSASNSAEYSRTSGGVISVTLKSGTNAFHGSETTLVRATALDANTIQNLKHGIANQGHRYINGQGALSGPIIRGKTFFMAGYQGFYEDIPQPTSATVPTDLQRLGDFSQTLDGNGRHVTIYDPLTTVCNAQGASCTRQAFPGDKIPLNRMNPVALALLNSMPHANVAGTISGAQNYFASPNLGRYRYNSYLTRIDHTVSDRHRLSFSNSANWGYERRDENGLPPPAIQSGSWPMHRNHYLATVDDTITLGDRMVLSTRVSFDRFHATAAGAFAELTQDLGFTTPYQLTAVPLYPKIGLGGFTGMFPDSPSESINNIYAVKSDLSRVAGSHLLKAGGEFRMYQLIRTNIGNNMGSFSFNSNFTQRDPNAGGSTTQGNAFASFLLGLPNAASVDANHGSNERYGNFGLFIQDDWQISRRMTLGLGLRWDYQSPVIEANNAQVIGFDPTVVSPLQLPSVVNPATNQPFGTLMGGVLMAGVNGNSNQPFKSDWKNFQPRLSATYKLTERMTARGNFGRSYLGFTACCGGVIQTGFNQTTSIDTYNPQPGLPFRYLDSPFPAGILQPTGNSLGFATGLGQGVSFRNPNFRTPYADQWMAGLSFDLPWRVGMNVAYVGNRVIDLPVSRDQNLIPITEQEKAIARLGGNTNYLNQQWANPFFGSLPQALTLGRETVSQGQLLKPYPQYTSVTENFLNLGYAHYTAFELSATKRLSRGLVMSANYTWSRRTEATSFLNAWDAQPFNDISGSDRPHRVAITGLYTLPFAADRGGLLGLLIGGWQYNVIGEIQSGAPIGFNSGTVPLTDHFALPASQQSLNQWFDTSTAAHPRPDGTYAWGSKLGANDFRVAPFFMKDVRGPAHPNWNMSLFKGIELSGGKRIQLRAEMFNVFNMRSYPTPQTDSGSAQFGQIGGGQPDQMNFPRRTQLGFRFLF